MPSSPHYIRDYAQEGRAESANRKKQRAMRNAARRAFEQASGKIPKGFDVDHKVPLSRGGSNSPKNLQLQRSESNRSYPRTSSGAMKSKRD